jgi:hypothetical protein
MFITPHSNQTAEYSSATEKPFSLERLFFVLKLFQIVGELLGKGRGATPTFFVWRYLIPPDVLRFMFYVLCFMLYILLISVFTLL